jgi:hypothetical protein
MAQNTPGKQLFDLLVTRGYDPEILDSSGKPAPTAEDAEIYSFEFITSNGTNHGTVVVMLGDDKQLELFSGDNVGRGMDSEDKTQWYEFQHQLKNFATKNFMTFGSQNINRLKYSMQGQAALKEGLCESWNGTKNVSWNGSSDSVRLMIRHKRPMGVNEARFRQVETLFVETAEGERYKLPFRNLAGGRAMVEHVRQGGRPYDMRGQHIANMVEELNVLSRFRRASHGRVFEGDTANLVSETNVYHATMSRTLKGLASSRGYNSYFESWNPADVTEQDLIIEDIKTLFVQETIDSRIEQALPILARIQQQGTAMKEANIFEAWAENLLEGTWATPNTPEQQQELIALLSQELPVGADATNATEQLYSLVGDDILFDQLQDLAEQDPDADCRNLVIARIKDMSNKGFEDFEPVLDALKSEQLAPATVAPEVPVAATPAEAPPAPVAEQDNEEYSVDGGMDNELLQDDEEPGSCNYTAEGEHCPEHGMMECGSGMYESELAETFEDELNDLKRLLGEGWKSELTGGTLGGVGGTVAGSALGALAAGPIGAAAGGVIGGAAGGTGGAMLGREMSKEEQLNEIAPLLAAGARAVIPLLAKVGPKLGQMASGAGKTGAQVAGKTAAGIGRGTADVAKSAAQSAAQNAGQIGLGVGAYQAITDVADKMVGGVGEVYRDAGQAASAIAQAVGGAIDGKTIAELAGAAVKYAIPVGILLAVLYGGKKLIDQVMAEGLAGAALGAGLAGSMDGLGMAPLGALAGNAIGDIVGSPTSNKGSPAQVKETSALQGQYGHSGKLQKFDEAEQDVLHRLRELSGMIRS